MIDSIFLFILSHFLIFIYFLILDLRLRVSMISHMIVICHSHSHIIMYHTEKYKRFQNNHIIL